MTASLLGSMLVFWAAHVWSEVVGERIAPRRGVQASRRAVHRASGMAARRSCRSPVDPARARVGRSMVSRDGREAGTCSGARAGPRVGIRRGTARRREPAHSHRARRGRRNARGPPARRRAARPLAARLRDDLRGSSGRRLGIGVASLPATVRRRSTKGDAMTTTASERRAVAPTRWSLDRDESVGRLHRQDVLGPDDRFAAASTGSTARTRSAPDGTTIELTIDADSLDTGNANARRAPAFGRLLRRRRAPAGALHVDPRPRTPATGCCTSRATSRWRAWSSRSSSTPPWSLPTTGSRSRRRRRSISAGSG